MSRPNVVVIMTDQQRWDTLGVYGNDRIRTPNLDRLAREGALFEQAFVPIPLCIPSRAALFTGRYPNRGGLGPTWGLPLPPGTPNMAAAFRAAGYRTMLFGKDHLFGAVGLDRHFDRVARYDHAGRAPEEAADADERAVRAFREGREADRVIGRDPYAADCSPTRRLTTAAIDAVQAACADRQPFFLWLSYPDPHPPYVVAEPYGSLYRDRDLGTPATRPHEFDDKPLRQRLSYQLMGAAEYPPADLQRIREIYNGMVSFIDDEVGRFMQALVSAGIDEETIIVFLSDHGDYQGDHGMVRKSPSMYDSLVRIPLFIRWPGRIPAMRVGGTLAQSIDVAPTLLELAGLTPLPGVEGKSLQPVLEGRTQQHKDHVFGIYGSEGEAMTEAGLSAVDFDDVRARRFPWIGPLTMRGRMAMVRTADWKLVYYRGGEGELYDVRQDPGELVNRYADPSCSGIRSELMGSLVDFLLDTGPA